MMYHFTLIFLRLFPPFADVGDESFKTDFDKIKSQGVCHTRVC